MKLSRPSRYFAALVTLFSLLFTQLAVAAYACPDWKMSSVSVQSSQAMVGCTEMDAQQPGLCKAHCDGNHQTLDTPAAPLVAPFVASTLSCVLFEFALTEPALRDNSASGPLLHATSPPISIRNCCFRI
jgi:hypothetical protein